MLVVFQVWAHVAVFFLALKPTNCVITSFFPSREDLQESNPMTGLCRESTEVRRKALLLPFSPFQSASPFLQQQKKSQAPSPLSA